MRLGAFSSFTLSRGSCDDAVPPHQRAGDEQGGGRQPQNNPKDFDLPSGKVTEVEKVGPTEDVVAQTLRRRRALSAAATAPSVPSSAGLPITPGSTLAVASRSSLTRTPARSIGDDLPSTFG